MTDVRDDAAGFRSDPWGEPGHDLDDLLTRWGSEQTGPWSRRVPRHAAADSITAGDELGSFGAPAPAVDRHASSPDPAQSPVRPAPAHQPDHPSWPAGTPSSRWAPQAPSAERAGPSAEGAGFAAERAGFSAEGAGLSEGTGRRHRPDGVPAPWRTRAGAAPNGVLAADLPAAPRPSSAATPRPSAAAAPPRFDDTGAYAGWVSADAAPRPSRPADPRTGRRHAAPDPDEPPPGRYAPPPSSVATPSRYGAGRYAEADPYERAPGRHQPDPDPTPWSRHAAADPRGSAPSGYADRFEAAPGRYADPAVPGRYAEPREAGRHGADLYGADPYGADPYGADPYGSDPYGSDPYGSDPYEAQRPSVHDALAARPVAEPWREDRFRDPDADAYGDDDEPPGGAHRRLLGPARNRRPRWVRTLGWVGAFLGILLVAGGGFAAYQYKKLSGNITRVDALAPTDGSIRDAAKQLDAENYLLIGSDSRAGENDKYGTVSGARSDTTILAHLSPKRDKATLISFPRDSWVDLPACPKTGGGTSPAQPGQFNEAFTIGGPSCTVLAVQKLTGVKINHYVQVDFTGFKTMVDALNGVPICTPTPLRDDESGLRLPAGTTTLKGEQALAFVRARYGIGDGSDLGRIQRQQSFLGAMVRAATGKKLLVNPVALTKFLGAATKSLTLDRDTSFGDLKQLADQLHGLDPKKVTFLTAPIANPAYTPPGFPQPPPGKGGSRVLLDEAAGRTLYDSLINDTAAPPKTAGPAKPTVLTVAPAEVSVRVLNGVGAANLGRTVSTDLSGVGFTTVTPSNAPVTAVTTVRYGPDEKDAAMTLAAAVPGAVLQPDASTDLDLVVGKNYTGVKLVKPGDPATAKPAAAPRPKATSSAPTITAADTACG